MRSTAMLRLHPQGLLQCLVPMCMRSAPELPGETRGNADVVAASLLPGQSNNNMPAIPGPQEEARVEWHAALLTLVGRTPDEAPLRRDIPETACAQEQTNVSMRWQALALLCPVLSGARANHHQQRDQNRPVHTHLHAGHFDWG